MVAVVVVSNHESNSGYDIVPEVLFGTSFGLKAPLFLFSCIDPPGFFVRPAPKYSTWTFISIHHPSCKSLDVPVFRNSDLGPSKDEKISGP